VPLKRDQRAINMDTSTNSIRTQSLQRSFDLTVRKESSLKKTSDGSDNEF